MAEQYAAARGAESPETSERDPSPDIPATPKVSKAAGASISDQEAEGIEEPVNAVLSQTPQKGFGKSSNSKEVSMPSKAKTTPRTPRNTGAAPGRKTPATCRVAKASTQGLPSASSPITPAMAKSIAARPKKRNLVRWSDGMDNKLLLAIQSACNSESVAVPWDKVGALMGEHVTGGAVVQHLAKLRNRMLANGESVPPPLRRGQAGIRPARLSGSSGPNTPNTPRKARKAVYTRLVRKRSESLSDGDEFDEVEYDEDSDADYGEDPRLKRSKIDVRRAKKAKTGTDDRGELTIGKDTENANAERDSDLDAEFDEDDDSVPTTGAVGWVAGGASFTKLVDDDGSSVDEEVKREEAPQTGDSHNQQSKLVMFKLQPQNLLNLQRSVANTQNLFDPATFNFHANSGTLAVDNINQQRNTGMASASSNQVALGQHFSGGVFNQCVAVGTQPSSVGAQYGFANPSDALVTPQYHGLPPGLSSGLGENEQYVSDFASFRSNVLAMSNFQSLSDSAVSNTMTAVPSFDNNATPNLMNNVLNSSNIAGQYDMGTTPFSNANSTNLTSFNNMNDFSMDTNNLNIDTLNGANSIDMSGAENFDSSSLQGRFATFHGVLRNQMAATSFHDSNWAPRNAALLGSPWQGVGPADTLNTATQQLIRPTIVETSNPTMATLNTPVNQDNAVINRLTEIDNSNEVDSFSQAFDDVTRFAGSQFE